MARRTPSTLVASSSRAVTSARPASSVHASTAAMRGARWRCRPADTASASRRGSSAASSAAARSKPARGASARSRKAALDRCSAPDSTERSVRLQRGVRRRELARHRGLDEQHRGGLDGGVGELVADDLAHDRDARRAHPRGRSRRSGRTRHALPPPGRRAARAAGGGGRGRNAATRTGAAARARGRRRARARRSRSAPSARRSRSRNSSLSPAPPARTRRR